MLFSLFYFAGERFWPSDVEQCGEAADQGR